jgi:beta-fructofuranosidase
MRESSHVERYASPIHYRPDAGRLADTIPFFWKGEYHIFYLRALDKVPWEHIVSTDLIHWNELPTALVSDGEPDSPDGLHMFTGSVIEKDGTFHGFYTGHNPANPAGSEFIMHATSSDLIHWTKRPEDILAPDGVIYSNQRNRDFRDPYVFRGDDGRYRMLFCSGAHTGLAVSPDLKHWEFQAPITSDYTDLGTPECPDYFRIGDTHYLIVSPTGTSSTIARHAADFHGPYLDPVSRALDTPILYAAKSLFDGKRQLLTGWLRDLSPERDDGAFQWGGTQCVPRELYAGADGQLCSRPVPEAAAVYTNTVLDMARFPKPNLRTVRWDYGDIGLIGRSEGGDSQCCFDVAPDYMLECRIRMATEAVFTLAMREQDAPESGYRLILRAGTQEAEIAGPGFRFPRRILLDAGKSISIQAFVQGTTIECFINDAYAFSCRAYNHSAGRLGFTVAKGRVDICSLTIKTLPANE